MPEVNFREEVLNVALAELLEQRGMLSMPETIRKSIARKTKYLPDILVGDLLGIRIVIEGRFDNGKASRDSPLKDSKERVENGISPVCLAVLYPPELRGADSLPKLRRNIEATTLGIRVISENSDGDWSEGTVDDIADRPRLSYELLITGDVVVSSVAEIEDAIDAASDIFVHTPDLYRSFPERSRNSRNAMIFHQVLAERDSRVESLSRSIHSKHIAEALLHTWTFIEKIDYIPRSLANV